MTSRDGRSLRSAQGPKSKKSYEYKMTLLLKFNQFDSSKKHPKGYALDSKPTFLPTGDNKTLLAPQKTLSKNEKIEKSRIVPKTLKILYARTTFPF